MYLVTEQKEAGASKHERKLCNCFGQLLLIYQKMLNIDLNMTLIVLTETLDIPEIRSRFDEYLAI